MKKKVLFVVQHLTIGGSQTSLVSALNAINYNEYEVTLYSRNKGTNLLQQINRKVQLIINNDTTHYHLYPYALFQLGKIKIKKLLGHSVDANSAKLKQYVCNKRIQREKERYFKKQHFDTAIAYMQGYTAEFVDKGIDADRKIVFYHGSVDEKHEVHETVFKNFTEIVGVSDIVSDFLRQCYPDTANKVVTLENYVDAEKLRQKATAYQVGRRNEFTLCTCGRLATDKCFDRAVEAAFILKNHGYSFHWYFVGDGPQREEIEELISQKGLCQEIELTGSKDNPFPYFHSSDVFVLCTDDEALPMTLIESKILCLPIISTKTAGGYALVADGENGLLVDMTAEAVAEAAIYCMDHPEEMEKYRRNLRNIDYDHVLTEYKRKLETIIG